MDVRFRKVGVRDLKRLNWIVNDPDVAKYLLVEPPVPMKSTVELYGRMGKLNMWYAVIADGKVAGSISLRMHPKGTKRAHVADLGIALAKEYWGRGLGGRAIGYVIREAKKRGISRLELTVAEGNMRARMLYESCGFKKEGVKRKDYKQGGIYYNGLIMARLMR